MFAQHKLINNLFTGVGPTRQVVKTYDSIESANEFLSFLDGLLEKYSIALTFTEKSIETL